MFSRVSNRLTTKQVNNMSWYFYTGLVMILIICLITLSVYRTSPTIQVIGEFGGVSLRIEYATTKAERERGLGGRENIPKDSGMLLVFPKSDVYGIWMKDMLVPLDIFWLDNEGEVVSIMPNVATSTYPNVFYPSVSAQYVLETAAGFARLHNISTGTPLLLKNFPSVSK